MTALAVAGVVCGCCLVAVKLLCRGSMSCCGIAVTVGASPYTPVTAVSDHGTAGGPAEGATAIRARRSGRRGGGIAAGQALSSSTGEVESHDVADIPAEPFRDASVGGHSDDDTDQEGGTLGQSGQIELVAGPSRTLPDPARSVSAGSSQKSFGDSDIDV